jgi:hypothetical protein
LSGATELAQLHELIGNVRQYVLSLKSRYGDVPAMRRVVNDADRLLNDLERFDIDVSELNLTRGAAQPHPAEKIPVPDTQYDSDFWRDVDDEGVGGQSGSR